MLFLSILGLSGCSSHETTLDGKYISTFDNTLYYDFSQKFDYITNYNNVWDMPNYSFSGTYEIVDNKITLLIDSSDNSEIELGYVYDNYIGSWWNGILPKTYANTTITNTLGDLLLTYNFKEDKSYEYTVTSNNEIVNTEHGTYTVNDNEVICTSEDNVTTTFISEDDKVFCIEYVKE